ncbi:dipeptidase [Homoserinibacter sp. YIM 151385]|uniref:dipeptidase n=1 Tax=Homoserinibacter sp. YIM 151385 TaxID=2985506 RepID=UPI0022F06FC2|nr:dipeptidase [Homoserinibacter sp. YIM 151385]WBU38724.1 dipeptidase [Homoserinibacter sp. YIM 151385]
MADTAPTPASPNAEQIAEAVHAALPASIAELSRLVRIPSVSWDGFDPAHVRESAEAIAQLVRELELFDSVEIAQSRIGDGEQLGQPAVLATRAARNGAPTVLLYAHHDVQPPGRDEDWASAPFEPALRGQRLYGRGAADDKAGVVAHLAAIRALVAARGADLDLGIVLFFEGEEEFGSRSFANFLADHEAQLRADAIVVADSGNWSTSVPALTVGLRGNVTFRLTVSTLEHASHSGMFGGAVPDAMLAAIRLLDTFWDADGSVAVEGMTVREAETPEYDEAQLRAETGLLEGVSPIGDGTILSRLWNKPTVTVTGIDAPSVVNASNTLIPSVTVKVSARVAPGQRSADAHAALERHIRAHTPFGAHVEIGDGDQGDAFLVDTSGWAVGETLAALEEAWGTAPVEMGVGGSIPFISDLVARFPEAQILVTGVEDPDSRAHSPNESLDLGSFHRSILAEALLLSRLDARRP